MGTKITVIIYIIILILFFLSVFGPKESKNRFWIGIRRIRAAMDTVSCWFYGLYVVALVLYIAGTVVYGFIAK